MKKQFLLRILSGKLEYCQKSLVDPEKLSIETGLFYIFYEAPHLIINFAHFGKTLSKIVHPHTNSLRA